MSEDDESVARALLAELEAGGELVDGGSFSIDGVQARTKLRDFQLADPHEYALLLIEAAVLAGADPVRIHTGRGELVVDLGPLRLEGAELDQLFAAAFVDLTGADAAERSRRRALQKLAFACNAALRLEPTSIEIAVVDAESALCLRLVPERERGELETLPANGRRPGAIVRLQHKGLVQELREVALIRDRCRFSNHKIELDGEVVSVGHRFALHVELDPERRALVSNARKLRPIELDGRRIGSAGLRYADRAPAEVWILTNGVLTEQLELREVGRVAAQDFGAIVELDLPKDLGQTKLAHGPEYERVVAAIWAVHDQIAPRPDAATGRAPRRRKVVPRSGSYFKQAAGMYVFGIVVVEYGLRERAPGVATFAQWLILLLCAIAVLLGIGRSGSGSQQDKHE